MLSYDPDVAPRVDPEALEEALEMGLEPVSVICDEPNAKAGDPSVSFIAFVKYIPRAGDKITLEDGKLCQVKNIHYKLNRMSSKVVVLFPTIYAVLLSSPRPPEGKSGPRE
jgi:hypothetical protein